MQKLLLTMIICLVLAMPALADVVIGGAIGLSLENISDPGGIISMGMQQKLSDDSYLRIMAQKLNFGNQDRVFDNAAGMLIYYFNLRGQQYFLGARVSADYEAQDADVGMALGAEILVQNKFLFFITTDVVSTYFAIDAVKRPDIDPYAQISGGLVLLKM